MKSKKLFYIITMLGFITYLIILFLFIVLKINDVSLKTTREWIQIDREQGFWNYNLTPFHTLITFMNTGSSIGMRNLLGNTIPFIPMRIFLGLVSKKSKALHIFISSLCFIFSFELIQFITCLGYFDIDDILLNMACSMAGFFMLKLCKRVF